VTLSGREGKERKPIKIGVKKREKEQRVLGIAA
jgi:hypothetical protein